MSNFYKFITSNASLWTGAGSLKTKYDATTIYQIRSVWYETTGTTPTAKFTADETDPNNKSYINIYLVLNLNQSSPTTCELHKIRFEFGDQVATVNGISSWTKDWPTTLTGSWTTTSVGWNVSTKTVIDTDYAYNTSIITLGTETAKYYGYRVNYPARNFADFVSTSASISGYNGSFRNRMNESGGPGVGAPLALKYDITGNNPNLRLTNTSVNDPISGLPYQGNWGNSSSFVYVWVETTGNNINTRFGFRGKDPTYMNAVDWQTGDILDNVNWPTAISTSLDLNGITVQNSWTQTSVPIQAWARSIDNISNNYSGQSGNVISYHPTRQPETKSGAITYADSIYLTEYSTAYVPPSFNTTTASSAAKLSELTNILSGTPLEIYNVWYTTAQAEGSETTTCWVYYAYKDAQSVVHYSTQEVSYNNITNAWTLSAGVYEATKTSSVFDPTPTTYTALYVGMSPFDIDVSPTSLVSLKTVYDASPYTNVNMSQIYNIWYDHTDTFNLTTPSPMTRTVDTWIYLLTDAPEDTSGNLIFETRRATYTITNTNASYTWTIPTDETITTTTHPDQISLGYSTSINTGYASIENSTLYYLAYFHFNIYTLTRENVVVNLIEQYSGINTVKTINEIWYDKSTIGADIYDASFNDTLLDVPEVSIKIYASGANEGIIVYNSYDISYNKNIRNWPSIIENEISSQTITSGSMETWTYQQIYYNPFYDMESTITTIKTIYNELYPTPGMDKVVKLWNSSGNNNNQTQLLFTSFLLNSSEIIKYTTVVYNRVENIWSIPNAEEEFNNVLSETVKYYDFIISELNGYATEIKNIYNQRYTEINQIVEIHKLWYNETSVVNSTINCLLFYSYQNENDAVNKTHFATIPINYIRYDINEDIDAYFSISSEANLTEVEYTYDNQNADFIELVEYTNPPTFVLLTEVPKMINDSVIRNQFDASYNEITGNTVVSIHQLWVNAVENVVSTAEGSITYSSPILKMWVYLLKNTQLYESRAVDYNLQLNEWTITTTFKLGNIRSSGLTTSDLTDYIAIYENLPFIPPFPVNTAISDDSLIKLKTAYDAYATNSGKSLTTILEMWYNTTTTYDEVVKCIVYTSYTLNGSISYSTFDIKYNTSLILSQPWVLDVSNKTTTASATASNIGTLLNLLNESLENYKSFYTKPVGTSILGSRIRYYDNSIQTTAMPPIGTIIVWSGNTLPPGYLWCNGQSYNPESYSRLFAVIKYNYGSEIIGGTTSNFKVPNLCSRFPMGYTATLSTTNDKEYDSTTRTGGNAQIKKSQFVHEHVVITAGYYTGINKRSNADPGSNSVRFDSANIFGDSVYTENNTTGSPTDFYPPFLAFNFIIKY